MNQEEKNNQMEQMEEVKKALKAQAMIEIYEEQQALTDKVKYSWLEPQDVKQAIIQMLKDQRQKLDDYDSGDNRQLKLKFTAAIQDLED